MYSSGQSALLYVAVCVVYAILDRDPVVIAGLPYTQPRYQAFSVATQNSCHRRCLRTRFVPGHVPRPSTNGNQTKLHVVKPENEAI